MHLLVEIARRAVEEYVRTGKVISPPADIPAGFLEKAGVFVCIKKNGELRGCIGTFSPCAANIVLETIANAVSAAVRDPRFLPLKPEDLSGLVYSVDVLSPPEKVSGAGDLDPRKYGVILSSGCRKGLLLPDLEGVDTVEDQLRITRMKAGIAPSEPVEIRRFTVARYS